MKLTGHTYACNNLTIFKYTSPETEIMQICCNWFWKISWNHIKWTYFWRVLVISNHLSSVIGGVEGVVGGNGVGAGVADGVGGSVYQDETTAAAASTATAVLALAAATATTATNSRLQLRAVQHCNERRRIFEDNLAAVCMGFVLVFLVCHCPR